MRPSSAARPTFAGYSVKRLAFPPEPRILAGIGAAALLGFVVGRLRSGAQGIYFAMITLALAQMVYFFCLQAPFTGGEDGIQGIPRGRLFGVIDLANYLVMYYFVLALFLVGFLLVVPHRAFAVRQDAAAIRENEPRAISLGYDIRSLQARSPSCSLRRWPVRPAHEDIGVPARPVASTGQSGEAVLMTLVGGIGTIFGPLVGAALIVSLRALPQRPSATSVTVVIGMIFIACVLMFRESIVGSIKSSGSARKVAKLPRNRSPT